MIILKIKIIIDEEIKFFESLFEGANKFYYI